MILRLTDGQTEKPKLWSFPKGKEMPNLDDTLVSGNKEEAVIVVGKKPPKQLSATPIELSTPRYIILQLPVIIF